MLLPADPGVYVFKNAVGDIIYIGKALSLRSRVKSYFNSNAWSERPKLAVMMPKVADIETILTNSEKEALLLERTLVRKHMPRYNVSLKDDRRYPWLAITYDEKFPRLIMVRDPRRYRSEHPQNKVFGPYVETGNMWQTVRILRKVFPMRQRKAPFFKDRPCLNYHMGLCLGPCQNLVEEPFYNHMVAQVELFLSGRQSEAVGEMHKEMEVHSEALEFEEAAKIRDRIVLLKAILEKQQVFFQDHTVNLDVISEAHTDKVILLYMMRLREGKLVDSEAFDIALTEKTRFDEAFQSFIEQYYAEAEDVSLPKEVLLQHTFEGVNALAELLTSRAPKHSVKLAVPQKGDKARLLEMARKNALAALDKQLKDESETDARVLDLLTRLKDELKLSKPPRRIECFDISNIQGTDNVASMVVFENCIAKKSDYRLFKIRSVEGEPNDFASMKEVVMRRYKRIVEDGKTLPDLVIIDGGKGQLGAALEALDELGVEEDLEIVGLAKRQEEVYLPGKSDPELLPRRSDALYLLQRVRDEAHRFAVTFHRKRRAKRSIQSRMDLLPGVGPSRRKLLLDHFGSFDQLRSATLDEIKSVAGLPKNVADKIFKTLHDAETAEA
jgi:excinuclease ABC subunit C